MVEIVVKADIRKAQRFVRDLDRRAIDVAAARAMNDTIRTVRAEGARLIKRAHPAMKIGEIKREMHVTKASRWKLRASVRTFGKPLSLLRFGASETRSGVSARIGQGRKRVVFYQGRKAFRVKAYQGEIFVRRFEKGRQIRRFRGPSMPGVFRAQRGKFLQIVAKRWPVTFASRMQHEINKAAAAAR